MTYPILGEPYVTIDGETGEYYVVRNDDSDRTICAWKVLAGPFAGETEANSALRLAVEPIVITNAYNESRRLVSAKWAGDTLFFFDENNLAYDRSIAGDGGEDMYEQLSCGDRWYAPHAELSAL